MRAKRTTKTQENKLLYIYDPFTRNEAQPKIPDGKMATSIGATQLNTHELDIETGGAPINGYETYLIFVMPGLNTLASIYYSKTAVDGNPAGYQFHSEMTNYELCSFNDGTTHMVKADAPANWRGVSFGSKLYPVSSDLEVDGYFETFCFPLSTSPADFAPMTLGGKTRMHFTPDYVGNLEAAIEVWRDTPSYKTGPIGTMSKYEFRQNVNDPEFPICHLSNGYNYPGQQLPAYASWRDAIMETMDLSHTVRCFRIRSKIGLKLRLEVHSNYEIQFETSSQLRSYQTVNVDNVDMRTPVARMLNNNPGNIITVSNNKRETPRDSFFTPAGTPSPQKRNKLF